MSSGLIDKVAKAAIIAADKAEQKAKLDRKKSFLLAKDTTLEDIKAWVPRVVESLMKENPYERTDHREGKKFECPVDYALLEGSRITIGNPFKPAGSAQVGNPHDVGELVFNEILNHGRQTMDELEKHLAGIDKHLLQVVINSMRMDYYLKDFKEKGDAQFRENEKGLMTLELVDYRARKRKLKKEIADRGGVPNNNRKLTATIKKVKKEKKTKKNKTPNTKSSKKDNKNIKEKIPIHY